MTVIIDFLITYRVFLIIFITAILMITLGYILFNIISSRIAKKNLESSYSQEPLVDPRSKEVKPIIDADEPSLDEVKPDKLDAPIEEHKDKESQENKSEEEKTSSETTDKPSVDLEKKDEVSKNSSLKPVEVIEEIAPKKPATKPSFMTMNFNGPQFEVEKEIPVVEEKIVEEVKVLVPIVKKELGRYHVLYRKEDDTWVIKREGSKKILKVQFTQNEAIAWATIKSISQNTSYVIHKKDGKIRKKDYSKK